MWLYLENICLFVFFILFLAAKYYKFYLSITNQLLFFLCKCLHAVIKPSQPRNVQAKNKTQRQPYYNITVKLVKQQTVMRP